MRPPHKNNSLAWMLTQKLRTAYPNWIHKGELQLYGNEVGYLPSSADRDLRHLVNEGWIVQRKKGKSLEYRFNMRHEDIQPDGSVKIYYDHEQTTTSPSNTNFNL